MTEINEVSIIKFWYLRDVQHDLHRVFLLVSRLDFSVVYNLKIGINVYVTKRVNYVYITESMNNVMKNNNNSDPS